MDLDREELERRVRTLMAHAWDGEVPIEHINAWVENFDGSVLGPGKEEMLVLFSLTRFLYFSKRMTREMLKALFRDHFRAPLIQRIRRNFGNTRDFVFLERNFQTELSSTRFIGVGNPSESGAHLLYYFRQVNRLPKDLFIDISDAFEPRIERDMHGRSRIRYETRGVGINRLIFFDDLVGSGTQASLYLAQKLAQVRSDVPNIELKYLSLFGTRQGLSRLNESHLFNGDATCLFELDDTYKAFNAQSRQFKNCPTWFQPSDFEALARGYGKVLQPGQEAGFKDGQLMLGFSHNTPDNTLPIFWDEGARTNWHPVFIRYDKAYS